MPPLLLTRTAGRLRAVWRFLLAPSADAVVDWLAKEKYVVSRPDAPGPYLTRWVLLGRRFDGSWGVYLHKFDRSDRDHLHDHPWAFVSLILGGGYWEATPPRNWDGRPETVVRRWYGPGRILRRPATWRHSVVLPAGGGPAWTVIFRTKKSRSWGFWCPGGYVPWRAYTARTDAGEGGCAA